MRQRIEDLGRLSVLIRNLLDHELFEESCHPHRSKDYWEWWSQLSEDRKDDILRIWVYGIDSVEEKLFELLSIAEGTDPLNENINESG